MGSRVRRVVRRIRSGEDNRQIDALQLASRARVEVCGQNEEKFVSEGRKRFI